MKKKTLAVVLSLAMAASLVACGSSNTTETKEPAAENTENAGEATTEEATEVEDVTLTVWGPQEDQSDENGKWLQTNCEAFAAEHPEWNITFNYGVCAEGDAKTNLATDAAAGADVYLFANDQIPDLLNSNAIAELGGSTVEKIKANNSEVVVNTVTYQDGIYGVPFTGNTWFMYYNKSIFTEDDVKNLDTMLSKGKVAFPLSNSWYIAAFYAANGCTLFGESGTDEAAGIDFSGDKAVEVTNYLVDLVKNPNFVNDADGVGMAGLSDGSIGAIFSGSWDYGNVKEALGDNMGIIAPPTFTLNGKDIQMKAFGGSKAVGVNPNSKYPQVAVALASYLGDTAAQQSHYELRNIIPTATSVDVSTDALAQAQADTMTFGSIVQPLLAPMGQYWTPAQNMGEELVSGSVTHDNAAEKTEAMNTAMNTSTVQ